MENSKVSIFVPTYNSEKTIFETLQSILNQTYKNIEVTIVDNASTDKTIQILQIAFKNKIKIIKNKKNLGAEKNFNKCLSLSNGKFTSILHADDIYHEHFIEKQVSFLTKHSEVGIVFTEAKLIDLDGQLLGQVDYPIKYDKISFLELFKLIMKSGNFLICPSAMFSTKAYKNLKIKWRGNKYGTSADLDIWFSMSKKYPIGLLKEKLIYYRKSHLQVSNIVRNSINKPDFFKLMDYYLISEKLLINNISQDNYNSYEALKMRDLVKRSLNLYIDKKFHLSSKLINSFNLLDLNAKQFLNKKNLLFCFIFFYLKYLDIKLINEISSSILIFFKKKF
ncbi:MAG: hypothetical protein CBB97_07960 [Candidatus Endolissoclinum sp. TMED37]|nr:MAG: hypothetical protein CBB97_07960 [Candidatus Endolissoclinum sp. TMED37]|tara:strand:+ start:2827 stop:3834 length:1008 start_codon:yes stop_codon:yes gene_type:complete